MATINKWKGPGWPANSPSCATARSSSRERIPTGNRRTSWTIRRSASRNAKKSEIRNPKSERKEQERTEETEDAAILCYLCFLLFGHFGFEISSFNWRCYGKGRERPGGQSLDALGA